jgi:hypothetical protein
MSSHCPQTARRPNRVACLTASRRRRRIERSRLRLAVKRHIGRARCCYSVEPRLGVVAQWLLGLNEKLFRRSALKWPKH